MKLKPELDQTLSNILKGCSNVPALLQTNPSKSLESLRLEAYEVFPTEPLHDFKGHFGNLVEESLKITSGRMRAEVNLNKKTLRCSDYRKAAVVLFKKLGLHSHDNDIVEQRQKL